MSTPPSLQLPPCARARWLATSRREIAVLDAVPAGPSGEYRSPRGTALLVPGFTGSKEDFIAVLGPLADDGWRVVAVDLPGQYESPWCSAAAGYDVARLAAAVLAVADALGDGPVHLLGHSFGGLVARAAILGDADGDAGSVASLTLLCSGPASVPDPAARRLRLLLDALDRLDLATLWAVMRQLDAENGVTVAPPPVAEFLERRFGANDPASLRRFAQQLLSEPDRVAELERRAASRAVPVLVAHGAGDDAWPPAAQEDMAGRLGARYEVLAGAAHSPAAEAPADTAALLSSFWAG